MADGPDINQLANFARMSMQSGGTGKSIDKMISPWGNSFSLTNGGVFKGNIAGPFGLRPKQGGMANQMAYEQQRLSQMNADAHAALAQACAAAAPAAAAIQQASMMEIQGGGHGLGQSFARSAMEIS